MSQCLNSSSISEKICTPTYNNIWIRDNTYYIQWNYLHPFYNNTKFVDIIVYEQNDIKVRKNISHIPKNTPSLNFTIGDTWVSRDDRNHFLNLTIIPSMRNDLLWQNEVQILVVPDAATLTVNATDENTSESYNSSKNKIINIILPVVISVFFFAVVVFAFCRLYNDKRKQHNQPHRFNRFNQSNQPIQSTRPTQPTESLKRVSSDNLSTSETLC